MSEILNKKIKSSTDWAEIETYLLSKSRKLANSRDVVHLIKNMQKEVTLLSKAEVDARRGKTGAAKELLPQINEDLEMVKEFLLVAALIG
jgi:hypothetical protein